MSDQQASTLCDDLLFPVHGLGLAYFGFTAVNLTLNVVSLPLLEAQKSLADLMVVLLFLLSAMAFSYFRLRHRFVPKYWLQEQAAIITLIAASTTSFIFFQYRFDTITRSFYTISVWLTHGFYVSSLLRNETSLIWASLGCGFVALVPAIHSIFKASSCQLPMTYDFMMYSASNALGGLLYLVRLPERLGGPVSSSKAIMHICVVSAAVVLSKTLLAAHASSTVFSIEDCRGLKW